MQSFRFLSVVFATSFVTGTFLAHADPDTAAQAAARAALQQQMNQTDTEESVASTNIAAPPMAATPAPPAVTTPTPQFSTNIPMNVGTNVPASDEMESAQMKSQTNMAALTAPPPSMLNTNETEQYPVNPAMAPLPPPPLETASTPPAAALPTRPVAIPASGSDNQLPANAMAQQSPANAPSGLESAQKTTNSAPNFENITAPPLPITPEKQAELQNLLSQYMANQITPGQYQVQRAKIMAEP